MHCKNTVEILIGLSPDMRPRCVQLRTRLRPCEFYTGTRLVTRECSKRKMSAISTLNPKAEVARAAAALHVNITAARGLQDVLKTNLGPKGTMKM